MTDTRQDKVRKLFESRAKAETELQRLQEKVQDAVEIDVSASRDLLLPATKQ